MTWDCLRVRPLGERGDEALYPVASGGENEVLFEPADGRNPVVVPVSAYSVEEVLPNGKKKYVYSRAVQKTAVAYVTEQRVALICSKYTTGSTSVVSPIAGTAYRYAKAAARRSGNALVGHVRYPWLVAVGHHTKTRRLDLEALYLTVSALGPKGPRRLLVQLDVPQGWARTMALDIVGRTVRYRLANTPLATTQERQALEAMSNPPPPSAQVPVDATWEFPSFYEVAASSAYQGDPGLWRLGAVT